MTLVKRLRKSADSCGEYDATEFNLMNDAADKIIEQEQKTEALESVINVLRETVLEVRAAQDRGPLWYTKGHRGLYDQVRRHLDRAGKALNTLEAKT